MVVRQSISSKFFLDPSMVGQTRWFACKLEPVLATKIEKRGQLVVKGPFFIAKCTIQIDEKTKRPIPICYPSDDQFEVESLEEAFVKLSAMDPNAKLYSLDLRKRNVLGECIRPFAVGIDSIDAGLERQYYELVWRKKR